MDEATSSDVPDSSGTSRRTLLKGAVAAGIGAAVYTSPIVSTVPAYAVHGLSSFSSESGTQCLWFSPNQEDEGQWHHSGQDGNDIESPPTKTYTFSVGAVNRTITFAGDPNNIPGNLGQSTGLPSTRTFFGGGVGITLNDANCEVVVVGVVCNSGNDGKVDMGVTNCSNTSTNAAPASWAEGSSLSPINQATAPNGNVENGIFGGGETVYYHSGRTGRGDMARCKWSMLFNIRCK